MGSDEWVLLAVIVALVGFGCNFLMPPPAMPDALPVVQLPAPVVVEARRLIEALGDLLAATDAPPPVALQQPKVLYQFADPALEGRSAGQKIMVRMGAETWRRQKCCSAPFGVSC